MRIESRVPLPPRSNGDSRRGSSPPSDWEWGGVSVWTIRQEREGSDLHPHVYLFITFMCLTMLIKKLSIENIVVILCRPPPPSQKYSLMKGCKIRPMLSTHGL